MPNKPQSRCTRCKRLHDGTGMCDTCKALQEQTYDQQRGGARRRGYDKHHEEFRAAVLQHDPLCVICGNPSTTADHYPRSRRQLEAAGLDPNNPIYGRGLCTSCHNRETTRHQPGGWNRPTR